MRLGSLFDGIGGFPLAAVRNGIEPVWASEIERFPMSVTKYRFPKMQHLGDITKLHGANLPVVEVIAGGSPCQDLSVAGKRDGLAGERSGLFLEQVRLVKDMRKQEERRINSSGRRTDQLIRPRYMVWENVPGAFPSGAEPGADFRTVLTEVCRISEESVSLPGPPGGAWTPAGLILGEGFSAAWRVLDAQFWGVPQRRNRIFLVADFGGHSAGEILFESGRVWQHYKEIRQKREEAAGNTAEGTAHAGGAGGIEGEGQEQMVFAAHTRDTRYIGPLQAAHTLTTNHSDTPLSVRQEPYCIAGNVIGRTEKSGGNGQGVQEGVCYTLTTEDRHCVFAPGEKLQLYQKIIGSLCAMDSKMAGSQYVEQNKCIVDGRNLVRKLMPLECERLMGFPDGWTDIPGGSDNKRYHALGNSVAVPCVDFILCGIAYFLSLEEGGNDVHLP